MKISIIGCGWLGLPLAKELISMGNIVKGTTTRLEKIPDLERSGINAFHLLLAPQASDRGVLSELLDCEFLIINIPSGRNEALNFHLNQMESLMEELTESHLPHCIYISSTGVYPSVNKIVVEEDVLNASEAEHKQIAMAEDFLRERLGHKLTIMRCAGLAGYDRNLARHFAGRVNLPEGNYPINHIHRDDVIGSLIHILKNSLWGEVYNIVSPEHPTKREYYTEICKRCGFELPVFTEEIFPYKVISPEKLIGSGYQFHYSSPYDYTFTGVN